MDGAKAKGRTIGEVKKLTGISRRELKYFIEQDIMRPSLRTESGYWAYSDKDIQKVQLAALCRRLDFPTGVIRAIAAEPCCWQRELERQIVRLGEKRERVESQLRLADRLLDCGTWETAVQIFADLAEGKAALAAE